MSLHRNRVQMTVTGAPGTGTITLNAATSGYQSFSSAYGADATVDILITEGNNWEVARNCAYTNSGTTVTRGTLEASSSGSAVSFTSAAIVSVIATADNGRRWDAAALEQIAGTDAATTMLVNSLYVTNISAWAASRTYTLPATAQIGDRCGVLISNGSTSRRLSVTASSGDTADGVAGGTAWGELFETGDLLVFRCVEANTTWLIDSYRLGAARTRIESTATQSCTGGQNTTLTTALNNTISNPGGWWASNKFTPKRRGVYAVSASAQNGGVSTRLQTNIFKDGVAIIASDYGGGAGTFNVRTVGSTFRSDNLTSEYDVRVYIDNTDTVGNNVNNYVEFTYLKP